MIPKLTVQKYATLDLHPATQKSSPYTLLMDFDGLFCTSTREAAHSIYAHTLLPAHITATVELLRECTQRGHKLLSITTLSSPLFELLNGVPQMSTLFSYFSEIVCTDSMGMQKSDPQLLTQVLSNHALNPRTCVMIDDQPHALQSATHVGISKTILCQNSNLSNIRRHLAAYGLL